MTEIRLINENETELLTTAYHWSDDAPDWFRQHQEEESLDDFLSIGDRLYYGVFADELTAIVRLTPFSNMIFNIDLFAKRKTDWQILCEAGKSMKEYLFDNGVNGFFGWISSKNRAVIRLYEALGFSHNGLVCYRGQYHNRAVRWLLMTCAKN